MSVSSAPMPPGAASSVAPTWEGLLAAALVGTARRRPPISAVFAELGLDLYDLGGPGTETGNRRSSPRDDRGEERQLAERAAGDPAAVPSDQGAADPAAVLLAEAAVLSAYRRAGRLPAEAPRNLPAPAEPDERPACSTNAIEVLELILSGEVPIPGGVALLAGQWLDGAARAGRRVPARLLPCLLDLGSANPALQTALRIVIGPRGRWLAGHHDRWGWAAGEPLDDLEAIQQRFATAAKAERPAILAAVRNADPGRGLELLRSTWKSDPAAERAALLAVLAAGLSDDDEPFLEEALDDRSAAVRQVAADLLARLPASRRAARMAERLRALIRRGPEGGALLVLGGRGRGTALSFAPPGEPDAAARRDGVNDAAPAGMGVSAWRLAQIIAGTPLWFWTEHLGLTPAETVALAAADDEPRRSTRRGGVQGGAPPDRLEMLGGVSVSLASRSPANPLRIGLESAVVAQSRAAGAAPSRHGDAAHSLHADVAPSRHADVAASRHADAAWSVAIFEHRPSPAILASMPPELAAEQLARVLAGGLRPGPAVAQLLAACPGPWPESLGQAVLDRYRQLGATAVLELQAALPVLAGRLDPSALPLVETWVLALADDQGLRRRVQTLGHALSLRAVIQREFPQ